jgi:radical SAM superfamily enzyme YgiQ (UPF0313 family)
MRVALVRPLYRTGRFDPEIQEPLGIETLAAALREKSHEVLLLDAMLGGQSEKRLAAAIAGYRPEVLGFSAMSSGDYHSIVSILGAVSGIRSGGPTRIVVGGNSVSTEPGLLFRHLPRGALGVRFEGELPLLGILDALRDGKEPEDVPSVAWMDGAGRLRLNPPQPAIDELDGLPFPCREFGPVLAARGMALNIQGSRGCLGSCAYCPAPSFPSGGKGARWRPKSPDRIADEMADAIRSYGVRNFNFVDDDFLGPDAGARDRAFGIADAIRRRGLRVAFSVQVRPSSLESGAMEALAEAGLYRLFVGVENDDHGILRSWGRPGSPDLALAAIDAARGLGVDAQAGAMLFHPDSTLESVGRFASLLSRMGLFDCRAALSRLQCLPGSRLHLLGGREGPFAPPLKDPRVGFFYESLEELLRPMLPAWTYAACALPTALAQERLSEPSSPSGRARTAAVRAVLSDLEACLRPLFFGLLEDVALGREGQERKRDLALPAFRAGEDAARTLAAVGERGLYDALRGAMGGGGPR